MKVLQCIHSFSSPTLPRVNYIFCHSRYYSGSKEFMAESCVAESFFKSPEGDSSLVGLSACECAQTGVDPMTFSNSEMILPSMILPYLSSNDPRNPRNPRFSKFRSRISEWTRSLAYASMFGPWSIKIVNELDRCSKDAQDMLLTYLDRMKPGHAFLGTTNLDLTGLTERFQTRFQSVRLQPPDNERLAAFLFRRWGAPIGITRQIAEGAKGNVRAAMADLEMWMG
ncbi:MAG: hypothetical protein NTW21_30970 [Verrucomicrobia bacterium]|nr:hypothetical protein [Verrucomicrobiota bacterium]